MVSIIKIGTGVIASYNSYKVAYNNMMLLRRDDMWGVYRLSKGDIV